MLIEVLEYSSVGVLIGVLEYSSVGALGVLIRVLEYSSVGASECQLRCWRIPVLGVGTLRSCSFGVFLYFRNLMY